MPEFTACSVSVPIGELWALLDSIVANGIVPDFIPAKGKPRQIRLNSENREWSEPRRIFRQYEYFGFGRYCLAFESENSGFHNLVSHEFLNKLDGRLGLKEPAFDGLSDLYKNLFPHMAFQRESLKSRAEILAPLPFALSFTETGAVTLSAPAVNFRFR